MDRQVNAIASSSAYYSKVLNAARPFLSRQNCLTIARAIIGSRLDYCNALLVGTSNKNLAKLQLVQNNALRAATGTARKDHISEVRRQAHWLPVKERIVFKTLALTHKCLHELAPPYLTQRITKHSATRPLRMCYTNTIVTPKSRKVRAGGASFPTRAATHWNALPPHIRMIESHQAFRKAVKTKLFV